MEGTFDDCQDLVKAMFADAPFREDMNLSAVNSINWARVAAQIPYYVAAAVALGSPDREVAFSVPTGNFGNVLAAWAARRIGVPIVAAGGGEQPERHPGAVPGEQRHADGGRWSRACRPSMDIQVSSNFERLLFELLDRDPACDVGDDAAVPERRAAMGVPDAAWQRARALFHGFRLDDEGTTAEIRRLHAAARLSGGPAYGDRDRGGAGACRAPHGADGGGGDGASGEVPGCDGGGDRAAAPPAAAAGRPI